MTRLKAGLIQIFGKVPENFDKDLGIVRWGFITFLRDLAIKSAGVQAASVLPKAELGLQHPQVLHWLVLKKT